MVRTMDLVFAAVGAALYVTAVVPVVLALRRGHDGVPPRVITLAGLVVPALALHAWVLYQHIVTRHGLDLQLFNALSLVSWLVTLLWMMTAMAQPVQNLALAVLPAAAGMLLLQVLVPSHAERLEESGMGLDLHILFSLVAYSVLSIAALQAVLLAVQEKHLRERHPGGFVRALPPLQIMEDLLFRMITVGFVLLSLALATGVLFIEDIFAQHLVHKTVLSIAAWIVFALLLWGRWRFGWRGRTAIRWTLGGFLALMLAYFGTKSVLEIILHR
jgi:ABC-type uncharacterized transport system permease subunit